MPSGLISTSFLSKGASKTSAASFENGCVDNPLNEDDQSTPLGSSSCSLMGPSSRFKAAVAGFDADGGGGVPLAFKGVDKVVVVRDGSFCRGVDLVKTVRAGKVVRSCKWRDAARRRGCESRMSKHLDRMMSR